MSQQQVIAAAESLKTGTHDSHTYTIVPRRSGSRGHADMGWLNTFHTFSFANYYDHNFTGFNSLRVLNEDRVSPNNGFGRHPHREYEIFSYVVRGALRHKDSLGNEEYLPRGAVQFTSAGTGVSHSEYNASSNDLVHFLQIWVKPSQQGLKPSYQTTGFTDEDKRKQLRLIVSPDGEQKSVKIHQDMRVYASLLKNGESVSLKTAPGREYYVHLVQDVTGMNSTAGHVGLQLQLIGDDKDSQVKLSGGDGAFLTLRPQSLRKGVETLELTAANTTADETAEFLVFDMASQGTPADQFVMDDRFSSDDDEDEQ